MNTGSGLATAAQGKPQAAAAAKQQPAVKPEVQPKAESTQKNAVEPQLEDVEQGEGEEEDESGEKKGPRKIEIRSGAEPSAPADDLVDSVGKPAE